MADLKSLAALLGQAPADSPKPDTTKRGYDGSAISLRIQLETKGRGGKSVTVIRGFQAKTPAELDTLCQQLKKRCGTGGTVGDNTIELQGDQRTNAQALLEKQGYRFAAKKN